MSCEREDCKNIINEYRTNVMGNKNRNNETILPANVQMLAAQNSKLNAVTDSYLEKFSIALSCSSPHKSPLFFKRCHSEADFSSFFFFLQARYTVLLENSMLEVSPFTDQKLNKRIFKRLLEASANRDSQ